MSSKTPDPMEVEEFAIRAAMRRRVTELTDSAAALADPRRWIREHPLATCAVAAGAGVAVGLRTGSRTPAAGESAANGNQSPAQHKEHQTLGALLAAGLVPTLQPMIRDLIHSAIGGRTAGPDKAADVADESIPSGLAEDNRVVD